MIWSAGGVGVSVGGMTRSAGGVGVSVGVVVGVGEAVGVGDAVVVGDVVGEAVGVGDVVAVGDAVEVGDAVGEGDDVEVGDAVGDGVGVGVGVGITWFRIVVVQRTVVPPPYPVSLHWSTWIGNRVVVVERWIVQTKPSTGVVPPYPESLHCPIVADAVERAVLSSVTGSQSPGAPGPVIGEFVQWKIVAGAGSGSLAQWLTNETSHSIQLPPPW